MRLALKSLSQYHAILIWLISSICAVLTWHRFQFFLSGTQGYSEFISSPLAFSNEFKMRDYYAFLVAALVLAMGYVILHLTKCFPQSLEVPAGKARYSRPLFAICYIGSVALYTIGLKVFRVVIPWDKAGLVALPFIYWAIRLMRSPVPSVEFQRPTEFLLVPFFSVVFSLASITTIVSLLSQIDYFIFPSSTGVYIGVVILTIIKIGLHWWQPKYFYMALRYQQLFYPLLCLRLSRMDYRTGGIEHRFVATTLGQLTLITITVLLLFTMIRKLKTTKNGGTTLEIVSPATIGILCFFYQAAFAPSPFKLDDFHLGEYVLPFSQLREFGLLPFRDLAPIHGLSGYLYGAISEWFFGGGLEGLRLAFAVVAGLSSVVTALIVFQLAGPAPALLVGLLSLSKSDRFHWVCPLTLIAIFLLRKRPMIAWVLMSTLAILWNAISGTAIALALLVPQSLAFLSSNRPKVFRWKHLLPAIVLIPAAPLLFGLLQFLWEHAANYATAHGRIYIHRGFSHALIKVGSGILLSSLGLFFQARRKDLFDREVGSLLWVATLFSIVIAPYALTSFSSDAFRMASVSYTIVNGLILSAVLIAYHRNQIGMIVIFPILSLAAVLYEYTYRGRTIFQIPMALASFTDLPDTFIREKDGNTKSSLRLVDSSRQQMIQKLNTVFDKVLLPAETFVDFTNHSALYQFLQRRVPSYYAADYVAVSQKLQEQMIKSLDSQELSIALVGPRQGQILSLHAYRLYRWLMEKRWNFCQWDDFSFLIEPSRRKLFLSIERARCDPAAERSFFRVNNLVNLPVSWGANPQLLSLAPSANCPLLPNGNDFESAKVCHGAEADLLHVELGGFTENINARLGFGLDTNTCEPESFMNMKLKPGTNFIPLGVQFGWLQHTGLFRICVRFESSRPKILQASLHAIPPTGDNRL